MRRKFGVDLNQKLIISALEKAGRHVLQINGVIDLVVSNAQGTKLWLMEIKNPKGYNKFTESQKKFLKKWQGKPVLIVRTAEEAIEATA